jgi:hypothetical protein
MATATAKPALAPAVPARLSIGGIFTRFVGPAALTAGGMIGARRRRDPSAGGGVFGSISCGWPSS